MSGKSQIAQDELLQERILRHKATQAVRLWKQHRAAIAERLKAGASVEPGPFAAELSATVR